MVKHWGLFWPSKVGSALSAGWSGTGFIVIYVSV